jgi:hypothetical protein
MACGRHHHRNVTAHSFFLFPLASEFFCILALPQKKITFGP